MVEETETSMAQVEQLQVIEVGGETSINDEVIGAIAGIACREIDGVSSLGTRSIRRSISERLGSAEQRARGVAVEAGRREAILDIDLQVIYGYCIPDIVVKVRQNVARRVQELAGLVTKEININVIGIEFLDRTPSRVE